MVLFIISSSFLSSVDKFKKTEGFVFTASLAISLLKFILENLSIIFQILFNINLKIFLSNIQYLFINESNSSIYLL